MLQTADVPNSVLKRLADDPAVESIHEDRPTSGRVEPCRRLRRCPRCPESDWAIKGAGVGVAVIDSGITSWHDDLTYNGTSSAVRTKAGQRVVAFADFVNGRTSTVRRQRSRHATSPARSPATATTPAALAPVSRLRPT